jgi:hypothetical protein
MFSVLTRLGDGELIFVASRDQLGQARQLVQELNTGWPREYVVRNSEGRDVEADEIPSNSPNHLAHDLSSSSFR